MPRQVVRDFRTCLNTGNFAGSVSCGDLGFGASANLTPAVTYSTWVKFNNFQTSSPFISTLVGVENGGTSNVLLLRAGDGTAPNNNKINFVGNFFGGAGIITCSSTTTLITGLWYHIVSTFDNTGLYIYINGALDKTVANSTITSVSAAGTCFISLSNAGTDRQMNGLIDDTRVYKRRLSATEITNFYYGVEPANTSLTAWYKLDEGSGTTATDSSGNANTGTITSATYSTDVFTIPRTAVT